MTGLGSPCGACKFLRRKCAKGCVFAPYFCHEQGAAHFAAIHKVFGASNVSKLLMQLPVNDRCEAAITISYEAQARLQDPVYGCVSRIVALQQQVVNLQSQLTSLKAQAAMQAFGSVSSTTSSPEVQEERFHNKFSPYQQEDLYRTQTSTSNATINGGSMMSYENGCFESNCIFGSSQDCIAYSNWSEEHALGRTYYSSSREMEEDLQSLAFAYLHHT